MDVCRKEYTTPYLIASCATTSGIRLFRFGLFRVGGWVCVGVGGFVWVWVFRIQKIINLFISYVFHTHTHPPPHTKHLRGCRSVA